MSLLTILAAVGACTPGEDEVARESPVAAEELIDRFVAFAHDREPEDLAALPLADQVQLGLGQTIHATRSSAQLSEPDGWILDTPDFRAYTGPLSALDLVTNWSGTTVTTIGEHPHCASPPVPPPLGLEGLRRVSVQPNPDEFDTCLRWWTVDFFLNDHGRVVAVTLDVWEP